MPLFIPMTLLLISDSYPPADKDNVSGFRRAYTLLLQDCVAINIVHHLNTSCCPLLTGLLDLGFLSSGGPVITDTGDPLLNITVPLPVSLLFSRPLDSLPYHCNCWHALRLAQTKLHLSLVY
jgi:hypothetical protein